MSTGIGRYAGVTTVIAALAATAVVALAEPGQQTASDGASVKVALTDDDGGQPMFVVPELAPGETVRRCITLRYSGDRPSRVALTADVSGALADRLQLTVARGTGGSFGSCEDFSGTSVYQGSLGDAAAGLERAESWRATGEEAVAYRFTIEAPAGLESYPEAARPTFAWTATPEATDAPSVTPEPETTPAPTAIAATPPRRATRSRRARGDAPAKRDTRPVAADKPKPDGGRPGVAANDHRTGEDPGFLGKLRRAVGEAAERAAFPLLLLLAMAIFVLLQNRLDKRDPKLALAPIHTTPDLPFEPLPRGI
jgi:hypothetical protein